MTLELGQEFESNDCGPWVTGGVAGRDETREYAESLWYGFGGDLRGQACRYWNSADTVAETGLEFESETLTALMLAIAARECA